MISISNHTHSSTIGNNCTKHKLKLYEAEQSMILTIAYTIISKLDESVCDCQLITQFNL